MRKQLRQSRIAFSQNVHETKCADKEENIIIPEDSNCLTQEINSTWLSKKGHSTAHCHICWRETNSQTKKETAQLMEIHQARQLKGLN